MADVKFDLVLDTTKRFLHRGAINNIAKMVNRMRNEDVAKIIQHLPTIQDQRTVFELINNTTDQAEILSELDHETLGRFLPDMDPNRLVKILRELPTDDQTDLLGVINETRREELLNLLESGNSEEIKDLLQYSDDTAGGIMSTKFFTLPDTITVGRAIKAVQEAKDLDMVFYIYLADEKGRLTGVLSLRKLLLYPEDTPLRDIMATEVLSVTPDMDQEEVAKQVARYNLLAVPVVNEGKMIGIITVDDVIDVIREEATEDILKMAGTEQEDIFLSSSPLKVIQYRLPWLTINLLGGLISGTFLWLFRETLIDEIAIVAFTPVIAAMGGNIGIQSSTIIIRGLATGKIEISDYKRLLKKELLVGLIIGTVCGVCVGLFSRSIHHNFFLGAVVGISMIASMMIATTMGTLTPIICKKLKIDPAISAGPFVTTANDITGVLIYLSLAAYFINYL